MILLAALLAGPLITQPPAAPAPITVTHTARSIQPGEIVVLTITVPLKTTVVSVRAFGRDVTAYKVDDTTWGAVVGIDLATAARRYAVAIEVQTETGTTTGTHTLRVTSKQFPTRRLRVDSAFVDPPASEQTRIKREAAELAAIWNTSSSKPLWNVFIAPVSEPANSAFGARSIFNGQLRSRHSGADFPSAAGTPIQAPGRGRVVMASALYYSGNTIVIDHGVGVFSLLAHLSEMAVAVGDQVEAGDTIGKVGATGRVTGPHLHWAVRANGARVDPLSVIEIGTGVISRSP